MKDECIVPSNTHLDKDGYPRVKWNKRFWRMNRMMWTLVKGNIPEGQVVAHFCNNTGCINTHHMYLCSQQQNSTDAARDKLYKSGPDNHKYRATPEIVAEMVRLYHDEAMSQASIGTLLGFSQSQVSLLIRTNKYDTIPSSAANNPQNL